uniref:Cupin 2 conserved barrel domain-containing protein n=1 Tax=viral metagenome TaxID=1070528 RepID=A0A6C0JGF6_9ZZZZ
MDNYISAYEYEKNVNPIMTNVPFFEKDVNECGFGINFIDFSQIFNVSHKSTTPNLLASFIKMPANEFQVLENLDIDTKNEFNGTSHLFYILEGSCICTGSFFKNEEFILNSGDIFITPTFDKITIKNIGESDLKIYYINDSPLVNYLGNKAVRKLFKSAVYTKEFLTTNLHKLSNPKNNRKGILLSNKDTDKIGTNTITPVLWALYNELPPNTVQKPHKHNSVALDLCIHCEDSDNIYTLIGDQLDEAGNIVNPQKVHWKQGSMFITPPGLWHSHNNIGNTNAYILPIQDAGLLLYQRILGIVLQR